MKEKHVAHNLRENVSDSTAKISDDYCSSDSRTESASCISLESIEIGSSLSIRGTKALFERLFSRGDPSVLREPELIRLIVPNYCISKYTRPISGTSATEVRGNPFHSSAPTKASRVLNTFSERKAREERQLLVESCKNLLTRSKELANNSLNFLPGGCKKSFAVRN